MRNEKELISSRQIAEATGKRHDHVMRDIREMCEQGNVTILMTIQSCIVIDSEEIIVIESFYNYIMPNGGLKRAKEYLLNEMAAEVLSSGYDTNRRHEILKLVRRLRKELEKRKSSITIYQGN